MENSDDEDIILTTSFSGCAVEYKDNTNVITYFLSSAIDYKEDAHNEKQFSGSVVAVKGGIL